MQILTCVIMIVAGLNMLLGAIADPKYMRANACVYWLLVFLYWLGRALEG